MATSEVQIDAAALHAEVSAFAEHINNALSRVTALREKGYIPIKRDAQTGNFFEVLRDGVLLGHLLAAVKPGSLDPKSLRSNIDLVSYDALCSAGRGSSGSAENQEVAKTVFEVTANLNACLKAAKDSGIIVVNIGANDFLEKRVDLMLGLIWQLIRAHLLTNVNLTTHPELIRLLGPKESLTTLINVPSETILLRWFNYHLSRAGLKRRIQNFSKDIQDSELYIALLREICPPETRTKLTPLLDKAAGMSAFTDEQKIGRAEIVLEAAEVLESREFATARDIATGNARLNLAFTATLFNNHIGIHLPSEDESRELVEKCRMQERRIAELESAHKAETKDDPAALGTKLDKNKSSSTDQIRKSSVV
ncbi:hypothetical protein M427DRAFT_70759 [Gonapodya prolifera JEL478]|uniref:Calponin-homology (CH) domain-containing protein n=1 Tax=Gonapodya prolifera (strain JEL478) TaxID=1344416 RepID=A0A139AD04_GONPJ|nr:hypothetical protein M427DRAFT_70759 [Gonapodya prolifera JEL478]|eukprot:KXS14325.1 hypothetical protein M427DRAFT_70759 [Gonapodya prolifera JEL478]